MINKEDKGTDVHDFSATELAKIKRQSGIGSS